MNKIAIFVEGKTETQFVKRLVGRRYKGTSFLIDEVSLKGKESFIRIKERKGSSGVHCSFLIIAVPSYERLVSTVLDNARNMVQQRGFHLLLGLRDLSPNSRKEQTKVEDSIAKAIARVPERDKIRVVLAIMEIEAWFLCEYHLFERMNTRLTASYIQRQLNLDLVNDDPELKYKKPSKIMDDILRLVGLRYRKHGPEIKVVVQNIDFGCLFSGNNKISSFFRFVDELDRGIPWTKGSTPPSTE